MLKILIDQFNFDSRYLDMILNDDIVKAQDRVNAFTFLMMGDRSNAQVVLDYLKENADAVRSGLVFMEGII